MMLLLCDSNERHTICWRYRPSDGLYNKLYYSACKSTGYIQKKRASRTGVVRMFASPSRYRHTHAVLVSAWDWKNNYLIAYNRKSHNETKVMFSVAYLYIAERYLLHGAELFLRS